MYGEVVLIRFVLRLVYLGGQLGGSTWGRLGGQIV